MYEFVDTIPGNGSGTKSTSVSIQTVFNNVNLDDMLTDENGSFMTLTVSGRSDAQKRIKTFEIPGKDGVLEQDKPTSEPRIISIKYKIADRTNDGFRKRLDKLNSLLEGSKKELKFTDEDAIFFATLQSNELPEEVSNNLVGELIFFCSDPYKYGPEQVVPFTSDIMTLTNNGTAEADPIFELEVKQPVTFAMIQNQDDEYMMIGEPSSITQQPAQEKKPILFDGLGSTAGWTVSDKIDDGVGNGQFTATQGAFVVSNYGTGSAWHGPAVYKQLNESLENYRIQLTLEFKPVPGTTGRVELYLLDSKLEKVGKLTLRDTWKSSTIVVSDIEVGGTVIDSGPNPTNQLYWNNFYGIMMLEKRGNQYTYYTTLVNQSTGRHYHARGSTYYDVTNSLGRTISAIKLHAGQYGNDPPVNLKIHDLKVYKINNLSDYQVPYIAEPGDVIAIDSVDKRILINGETRNDLLVFGANFFSLKSGQNQLMVFPNNAFDVTCRYREGFR